MLKNKLQKPSLENLYLAFGYYFFIAASFYYLIIARTEEITATPWQVVSPHFFWTLGTALIFLIFLNKRSQSEWAFLNNSIFVFLILNVGNIVYPLGFGFDSFIHQATEKILVSTGTIEPKPLAYVGHYVLVAALNFITRIKIENIDRWLPSIIAALVLPAAVSLFAKKYFGQRWNNALLIIFILPFAILANPTPQALSIIYVISAIFLFPLVLSGEFKLWKFAILTLAALFIHPLAGIPIAMLLAFALVNKMPMRKIKIALNVILAALSAIAYPLAFWLLNFVSANKNTFGWQGLDLKQLIPFFYTSQKVYPLDLAYLIGNFSYLAIFLLAICGIYLIFKKKMQRDLVLLAILFLTLTINSLLLLSFVKFGNIAGYEQGDFALRIIQIAFYSLMPLALVAIKEINFKNPYQKIFSLMMIATAIISSTYLSYPRNDDYQSSSFQNVSRYDISAVDEIERSHHGEKYAVLANQITSAAAVKEFGLDRNIKASDGQEIYFYPIPTGGKLYSFYMPLLYENGTAEKITEIKKFTQTDKLIVVVSRNWKRFSEIDKRLSTAAAQHYNNGQIFIYEF